MPLNPFESTSSTTRSQSSPVGDSTMNGLTAGFGRLVVMDNPPPTDPAPAVVDQITATELNQLSRARREEALFDVHGIREGHEGQETPEFLNDRLLQMEKALNSNISPADRQAYDMAMAQNAPYVQNPEFRLMFLRCDLFDPIKAASRFARHFQAKLELFDSDLLCKDIAQDDLNEDGALKCLYSGWTQELPIRDISGRLVSITFQQVLDEDIPVEEKLRAVFYRRMNNATELETQRKGVVFIIFNSARAFDRVLIWKTGRLLSGLPIRFVAYHMCFEREQYEKIEPVIALGRMAVESFDRNRQRVHIGSPMELRYALQTFGIPVATMPIDDSGIVSTQFSNEFWKQQLAEERKRAATAASGVGENEQSNGFSKLVRVKTPGKYDVLSGRGRSCQNHPGNVRFRFLIEQNLDRYENHKKHDKKIVAVEILNAIRERGGRFLTATDEGWIECDEITAREKVSSCFRSLRKVKGHGASGGAEVQEFSLKRNLLVGQTTTDNATELS